MSLLLVGELIKGLSVMLVVFGLTFYADLRIYTGISISSCYGGMVHESYELTIVPRDRAVVPTVLESMTDTNKYVFV